MAGLRKGRNLGIIFDQLRAEPAPATIIHNEYSAVPTNYFGDYMLVRRVSGEATCELPKREPTVVFNKNLKDLIENTIWIKHPVYSTLLLGTRWHQRKHERVRRLRCRAK